MVKLKNGRMAQQIRQHTDNFLAVAEHYPEHTPHHLT